MSLSSTERGFLQRLVSARPSEGATGKAAVFFSEHYGLGHRAGRAIFYVEAHYAQAAKILASNGLPAESLGPDATRAQAAQFGGMSEKSGSRPPHEGEIAVVAGRGCRLGETPWESPVGTCLVSTPDTLQQVQCDAICVVENWEAMKSLHLYRWLQVDGARVLYVFRGDTKFSPGPVKSFLAGRSDPLWAFVDFDPAGLGIANGLPGDRLARLILPAWDWLASAADTVRGRELFDQQVQQWSATLESSRHPVVRSAWAVLSDLKAGVTQERMLAAPA